MEENKQFQFNMNIPEPEKHVEEDTKTNFYDTGDLEINADSILREIVSANEEGHSPSVINMTLEILSNVEPGKDIFEYGEDDRELVDKADISGCLIDLYSLDGVNSSVEFIFDSPKNAFFLDMYNMFTRYRQIGEDLNAKEKGKAVLLTINIVPEKFKGKGICLLFNPDIYVRSLTDNGENSAIYTHFNADCTRFYTIDMTEEEELELTADLMRDMEQNEETSMFSEPM